MAVWSDLHGDLLEQVAVKLVQYEDLTAFRGVCTSWRGAAAAVKDKFVGKVPLLMFPGEGEVYSLRGRKIFSIMPGKAPVKETLWDFWWKFFCKMPSSAKGGKRYTVASFGWIVTDSAIRVSLINPRSWAEIQLPSLTGKELRHRLIMNAVLSANPSESSDFILMAIVNRNLRFWRNGDDGWSMINGRDDEPMRIQSICYYKNKLYALDYRLKLKLWMWDPYSLNQTAECILKFEHDPFYLCMHGYLVESSKGELVLVHRNNSLERDWFFKIFRIDTEKNECVKMQSLGGDAIFVDCWGNAVSVAAAYLVGGGAKSNCIYFPGERSQLVIYNVELNCLDYEKYPVEFIWSSTQWLL